MRSEILDLKNCQRIAVMGGAFDPIHNGHLAAAEAVRHQFSTDCVLFVPSGRPPHKNNGQISLSEHRYLMTVLATANNPRFHVSRIEIDRTGPTYTVDTIRELRNRISPSAEIFFITGADAIQQILTWKNAEELFTLCHIIAVTRPGFSQGKIQDQIKKIEKRWHGSIHFLEIPALSISSSDIRSRILNSRPVKYLLPEEVEQYIDKYGLYLEEEQLGFHLDLMAVDLMLQKELTERRYRHTQGTAEEAVRLSRYYGAPANKAYIAGLFHDCAKDFPNPIKRKMCRQYQIDLDPVMEAQIDLCHGFLAAEIADREYGVTDEDILNAIRYHTTGRRGMSLLEKIIYIADGIEPERPDYPELAELRTLAYQDLDQAVIFNLRYTISKNRERERLVHPYSIEAMEALMKQQ